MTANVLIWSRRATVLFWAMALATAPALAQQKPEKMIAPVPVISTPSTSATAAEQIKRRLDETFPIHTGNPPNWTKAPQTPARPATPRGKERVTLKWRIALLWPEEIAPAISR